MSAATQSTAVANRTPEPSVIDTLMDKYELMMQRYWNDNPDLYRIVQQKKQRALAKKSLEVVPAALNQNTNTTTNITEPGSLLNPVLRGAQLRRKIYDNQREIRQQVLATGADIIPRTQAHNRKCAHQSLDEAREFRAEVMAEQIRSWRSMLPSLIKQFSRIPDPRRATSIKHKITVLMVFGLFAFIFRLSSRREMNRELTSTIVFDHLKKLFPEIVSIPHADTLARILEQTNPKRIEAIHINLVKSLIMKKKFKKLLIKDCLPIAVDGTQKLYRQGLLAQR